MFLCVLLLSVCGVIVILLSEGAIRVRKLLSSAGTAKLWHWGIWTQVWFFLTWKPSRGKYLNSSQRKIHLASWQITEKIEIIFSLWYYSVPSGYRNHLWSCHGCSRGVCLFIHQCSVKWGKFSSVILVVERQNKEHECVEKEDLFEHENVILKL